MSISITCTCGRQLKARDEFAGTRAECPTCGRTLTIPGAVAHSTSATGDAGESARAALTPDRVAPEQDLPERESGNSAAEAIDIQDFLDPPAAAVAQPVRKPFLARSMFEALLDPRSIQWMLMLGGGLLVLGVIVWLVSKGIFEDKVLRAVTMGLGTLAILGVGGWLELKTRFRTAGQALTFLGCVIAPLNLWFYHYQGLITLDNNLWVGGVVCCLIYAGVVYALRDPLFMYAVEGGITLTVLLLLADLEWISDTSFLCVFLVAIGLISIHAERAFDPAEERTFNRRRFGMPLFWSGHAQLASGLLLLLGTQAWGWTFDPARHLLDITWTGNVLSHSPIPILAGGLWLAGTYAYLYSDIVVRRIGMYTYIAAFCLLLAEVTLVWSRMHGEGVIAVLALTALAANLVLEAFKGTNEKLSRAVPPLAIGLSALPVLLGVAIHTRATSELVRYFVLPYDTGWVFVVVMALVAVSTRISAFLFRRNDPKSSAVYFFFSAASLIVAAAGLLRQVGYVDGMMQAPILMLIPLAYLIAARLWMGHSPERPLVWVAHTATAVILLHVVFASVKMLGGVFEPVQGAAENLRLGLIFSEAALFYTLAGIFRKRSANVYFAAGAACGALWQFMGYWGHFDYHYYTMLYALLGIVGLAVGRAVGVEEVQMFNSSGTKSLATRGPGLSLFQSGNAILFIALLAAFLQGLSQLTTHKASWLSLSAIVLTTVVSFLAIAVVPAGSWRRLYWTSSLGLTGLCFLMIHVLSLLSGWQKFEIFCIVIGTALIVVGYISRFKEIHEEYSESLTLGLWIGSLLVTLPLLIALSYWRFSQGQTNRPEEMAIVAFTILMLVTGVSWQVKATTVTGGAALLLDLVVTLVEVAYRPQVAMGIYLAVGGAIVFLAGLVLSIYRDKLLQLPDKIARREGLFQIMGWR